MGSAGGDCNTGEWQLVSMGHRAGRRTVGEGGGEIVQPDVDHRESYAGTGLA